ncbi:MAG: Trk family potassium uptake protein [Oscillospiraceae bacterium]|nr:Trk family potassium uptake protein [Oscillospiraceae bacterium]
MKKRISHLQIIALGYFIMICLGTMLLMLPIASKGESATFIESLFTTTSATCVTGLVLRDTATAWSGFGQAVILVLIQVGGLGFMTMATLFFKLLRKQMGLREKELIAEGINTSQVGSILNMSAFILKGTLIFEGTGALLLAVRFIPRFGFGKGIWYSVFHSVSAFCNAGFDLFGAEFEPYCSLVPFSADAYVNIIIIALITIGGLGFFVWEDLLAKKFRARKWALHTKLVITTSAILLFGGALIFFFTEDASDMSTKEHILTSLFASATARTAGFNTTDTAAMSEAGVLTSLILMFIGGSSGSIAGGIKTTTAAVLVLFALSQVRRQQTNAVFGREIAPEALKKAVTVFLFNLILVLTGSVIICAIQKDMSLSQILFEVFSAVGTVGMTMGITRDLALVSKIVLVFLMYCGRVGSVSFALAMLEKRARPAVSYPREEITIG